MSEPAYWYAFLIFSIISTIELDSSFRSRTFDTSIPVVLCRPEVFGLPFARLFPLLLLFMLVCGAIITLPVEVILAHKEVFKETFVSSNKLVIRLVLCLYFYLFFRLRIIPKTLEAQISSAMNVSKTDTGISGMLWILHEAVIKAMRLRKGIIEHNIWSFLKKSYKESQIEASFKTYSERYKNLFDRPPPQCVSIHEKISALLKDSSFGDVERIIKNAQIERAALRGQKPIPVRVKIGKHEKLSERKAYSGTIIDYSVDGSGLALVIDKMLPCRRYTNMGLIEINGYPENIPEFGNVIYCKPKFRRKKRLGICIYASNQNNLKQLLCKLDCLPPSA